MEELLSLVDENTLYNFLLLFARIVAFMAFMPVFGHSSISSMARVGLAFFLSIFLFSIITPVSNISQADFILGLFCELLLGVVASILVNIIFDAVKTIGEFVGYASALSMANFFDAASGTNMGIVARFLYYVSLAIFFEAGLFDMTIVMLAKSFDMVHLGAFNIFSYDGIAIVLLEIQRMFAFAFSFALPLFFIGFILDVYYGYGTKSMPSFSPFVITFQIKFTLIFLFMMFGLDIFSENFVNYFVQKFE